MKLYKIKTTNIVSNFQKPFETSILTKRREYGKFAFSTLYRKDFTLKFEYQTIV